MTIDGASQSLLSSLTTRELRYFLTVADTLNFRRAAEQLYISQPSLSRQVKALEERLGVVLFDRGTRSVQLTTHGRLLTSLVRDLLDSIDAGVDLARQASLHPATLHLIHCAEASSQATRFGARLSSVATSSEVHLHEVTATEFTRAVAAGGGAIGIDATRTGSLTCTPWADDPVVAVLPHGHSLSGQPTVRLEDLSKHSTAALGAENAPGLRSRLEATPLRVGAFENGTDELQLSTGVIVIDVLSRCSLLSLRYEAVLIADLRPLAFTIAVSEGSLAAPLIQHTLALEPSSRPED